MAELAYAHDSGSCPRTWVWVQVPSTALMEIRQTGFPFLFIKKPVKAFKIMIIAADKIILQKR